MSASTAGNAMAASHAAELVADDWDGFSRRDGCRIRTKDGARTEAAPHLDGCPEAVLNQIERTASGARANPSAQMATDRPGVARWPKGG